MNLVVISAGGTAGHINAAISLGEYLTDKGYEIHYLTGKRYLDIKLFEGKNVTHLESRPLRTKNPLLLIFNLLKNLYSFVGIVGNNILRRPKFVIGAGGYVCGPSLMGAWVLGIPVYIIEQNACVGLTNKILAKFSKKIFTHFKNTKGLEGSRNTVIAGNPVRNSIKYSAKKRDNDDIKNILVFGGSLGALQINSAIEYLILNFDNFDIGKIAVLHQVGKDNLFQIKGSQDLQYNQVEYIEDMQKAYEWADIIIARAGASTISELRIIAKPSILIPYPAATDNHQFFNAQELKDEKNFFIEVVDNRLKEKELAEKLIDTIRTIKISDLSNGNQTTHKSACETIFQEIKKDVWN